MAVKRELGTKPRFRRTAACGRLGCSGLIALELSCRGCGDVWYCSENCKRQHWASEHKEECTKLGELLRLRGKAADSNDRQATERMTDACVRAMGTYFSKRLRASDGDSLRFDKFRNIFNEITSSLRSYAQFEEHFHIMLRVLEEAEQLRQEGRLVMFHDRSTIKNEIQCRRAVLYAQKAKVLKQNGDSEASSAMFEQAVTIARGMETDDPIEAQNALADIERKRAEAHDLCNEPHAAIRAYEEAYILRQENCSPDDIQIQPITQKLVELYREVGDYEKVDYFAGVLVENLENQYRGQLNVEIGYALVNRAAGLYSQAASETDREQQRVNVTEYEKLILKAVSHLRSYKDRSSQRAFSVYKQALKPFLIQISDTNRYGETGDIYNIRNIINQYIDDCQEHINISSARGLPPDATEEEDLKRAYRFLFGYYLYRFKVGPPTSEEERPMMKRRELEYEALIGDQVNTCTSGDPEGKDIIEYQGSCACTSGSSSSHPEGKDIIGYQGSSACTSGSSPPGGATTSEVVRLLAEGEKEVVS